MDNLFVKKLIYVLTPLAVLILLALLSCTLSYGVLLLTGDKIPLHKLISKGTQIFLVLSLFPLRRYLKLSWVTLGFAPKKVFFKQLIYGLGLGLCTLMPILVLLYGLEVHIIDESKHWTISYFFERLLISLVLALLISFVEEPLFRGLLLTGLQKKMALITAILVSSSYYAALHFLKNKTEIAYDAIEWTTSFTLLVGAFSNWFNPDIISAFIALLMVGIFLAIIRVHVKQSLGLCIGYHASWVWQIKLSKDWLNTNHHSQYLHWVSPYDGVVGPLVSVWMLGLISVYLLYQYPPKQ